jgi:hypothetical protein
MQKFWCGNLTEGSHLKYPGVDGRIIFKWNRSSRIGMRIMDWIELAEGRDRWQNLLNAVTKLEVS